MDPIIEAIVQKVLIFRHTTVPIAQLRTWAEHLRDTVQPKLDEYEQIKAASEAVEAVKGKKKS